MALSGQSCGYQRYIKPQHFALTSCGAALGVDNRIEISYAHQTFNLDDVAPGMHDVHAGLGIEDLVAWMHAHDAPGGAHDTPGTETAQAAVALAFTQRL